MNFPGSSIDHLALRLRWFDHQLKGHDNGIMDEPPVLIYVMGDNVWREENEFPLARQQEEEWFLREGPAGSVDSLNDGRSPGRRRLAPKRRILSNTTPGARRRASAGTSSSSPAGPRITGPPTW